MEDDFKAVLVGDIHLADKPPRACTDKYTDNLFDMLYEVRDLAVQFDAQLVALAGDVFHYKAPTKTSHELVSRTVRCFQEFSVPLAVAVGNHDIHYNSHKLFHKQPLSTVLVALQAKGGLYDGPDVALWHWGQSCPQGSYRLAVAHQPIAKPHESPPWDCVYPDDMKGLDADVCFYGHIHEDVGVWRAGSDPDSMLFVNHGALCRGTLSDSDLERNPCVTLWSRVGGVSELTKVPLESALAVEDLYDPEMLALKSAPEEKGIDLDDWYARLREAGQAGGATTPLERAVACIRAAEAPLAVKEAAEELLSNV